jgi:streptomycin 6-kinase
MAMRKPGPTIALMIGMPHAEEGPQDEDHLSREQDNDSDDDIATEAIVSIVHNLHQRGPSAIRDLRAFTEAIAGMCEAHMARDRKAFEEAAYEARDALEKAISQ